MTFVFPKCWGQVHTWIPIPPRFAGDPGGAWVASRFPAVTAQMGQGAGSLLFPSRGQRKDVLGSWDCPQDLSSPQPALVMFGFTYTALGYFPPLVLASTPRGSL